MVKLKRLKDSYALFVSNDLVSKEGWAEGTDFSLEPADDKKSWILRSLVLSDDEKALVKKLEGLSWHDRVEGNLEKALSVGEYKSLVNLLASGAVVKYKGDPKYPKHIFLTDAELEKVESKKAETAEEVKNTPKAPLFKKIADERDAYDFSRTHYRDFKQGKLLGVKDFAGNYFVISRSIYEENYSKIIEALRSGKKGIKHLSELLELDESACEGLIEVMKEKGLVYEYRKGIFDVIK